MTVIQGSSRKQGRCSSAKPADTSARGRPGGRCGIPHCGPRRGRTGDGAGASVQYDVQIERATVITRTNDGASDLLALHRHLLREPQPTLQFLYLADGDQRDRLKPTEDRKLWPLLFLPTADDPDSLLMSVGGDISALAARLGVSEQALRWQITDNEGKDPHDWVDDLAGAHDYATVMTALADLWVESHPDEVAAFHHELRAALG